MFGLETGLESRCGVPLHIIINIDGILAQLFKWAQPQIDAHLRALGMAAEHSGGGIVADVPRQQPEYEQLRERARETDRLRAEFLSRVIQRSPSRGARGRPANVATGT